MTATANKGRTLPHSLEAEEYLLSCALIDGADVLPKARDAGIRPESFYDGKHGIVFAALCRLLDAGQPTEIAALAEELKTARQLDAVGGYAFLVQVSGRIPTTAKASYFIEKVREQSLLRDAIRAGTSIVEGAYSFSGDIEEFAADVQRQIEAVANNGVSRASVIDRLVARRAGFGRVVIPQEPAFSLAGTPVFTRGNISMITAQKKEGKSAVCGALLGAVIGGPDCSGDTLRFTAANTAGHAVIHLDTEQAPEDHERLFTTALKRSGHSTPPAWIYSYGVKGVSLDELHRTLARLLKEARKLHRGILAVILDGVADFVADPNKPETCNPFVTYLESIATDYNASVICVLHLNPISQAGSVAKSRGHLGSQLERKCETDLRLVKDADGITTMFTACARRAPILEKDGPRFSWETAAGMHTTLSQTKGSARESEEAEAARELAADVFGDRRSMRYSDLISTVKSTVKCSDRTAERKVAGMKKLGAILPFPPNLWAREV